MRTRLTTAAMGLLLLFHANPVHADALLYGALSGPSTSGALAGSVITIDPVTGLGTVLGAPIAGTGITGLAVDSSGRLLASTSEDGGAPRLIEVNPSTGALVSVLANLTFGGSPQAVTDLAFDPTTNTLYGVAAFGPAGGNNQLLTIDMTTGATTSVGFIPSEGGFKMLAASDGGTLYSIATFGTHLHTIDPTDASIVSSMGLGVASGVGALGMTVRAADGLVFFTDGDQPGQYGRVLYTIDPGSGSTVLVGSIGVNGNVHDLVFIETVPEPSAFALLGLGGLLGLRRFRHFVGRS